MVELIVHLLLFFKVYFVSMQSAQHFARNESLLSSSIKELLEECGYKHNHCKESQEVISIISNDYILPISKKKSQKHAKLSFHKSYNIASPHLVLISLQESILKFIFKCYLKLFL